MTREFDMDAAVEKLAQGIERAWQVNPQPRASLPTLVAVTPENAAQFQPVPKRRGRKPKVQIGGNVVAFERPASTARAQHRNGPCSATDMLLRRFIERMTTMREGPGPKGAA